jgi:hypothetical protein
LCLKESLAELKLRNTGTIFIEKEMPNKSNGSEKKRPAQQDDQSTGFKQLFW